jgi:hypothetical protein
MPQGGGGAVSGGSGGTNMNSIGPGAVRKTYGQGSPGYVAPRTVPSDITGTK